jgi:hypothetical protein
MILLAELAKCYVVAETLKPYQWGGVILCVLGEENKGAVHLQLVVE